MPEFANESVTRFIGQCSCGSVLDCPRGSTHPTGALQGLVRADAWKDRHTALGHMTVTREYEALEGLAPPIEDE